MTASERFDLVVRGATVVDGTGDPRSCADVGVRGERFAAVGNLPHAEATPIVDGAERMLAPGFVDMPPTRIER